MRALLLLPVLALAACGGSDSDTVVVPDTGVVASDIDPCEALTPADIASALGVDVANVALDQEGTETGIEMGIIEPGTMCNYEISGDAPFDNASVTVSGYDSPDAAEAAFSSQYRARTAEETAQIESAGDRAAEEMVADGRADADAVEGMGGTLSRLANSSAYEPAPGIGDQAVVEINNILDPPSVTSAFVRDGATVYALSVAPDYFFMQDAANADAIRDAHVALAREVVR